MWCGTKERSHLRHQRATTHLLCPCPVSSGTADWHLTAADRPHSEEQSDSFYLGAHTNTVTSLVDAHTNQWCWNIISERWSRQREFFSGKEPVRGVLEDRSHTGSAIRAQRHATAPHKDKKVRGHEEEAARPKACACRPETKWAKKWEWAQYMFWLSSRAAECELCHHHPHLITRRENTAVLMPWHTHSLTHTLTLRLLHFITSAWHVERAREHHPHHHSQSSSSWVLNTWLKYHSGEFWTKKLKSDHFTGSKQHK